MHNPNKSLKGALRWSDSFNTVFLEQLTNGRDSQMVDFWSLATVYYNKETRQLIDLKFQINNQKI